jgi:hypothetical protein
MFSSVYQLIRARPSDPVWIITTVLRERRNARKSKVSPCCNVGVHRIDFFFLEEDHYPWLEELHSKIWGGAETTLIRTVKVTEEDYMALKRRVNGLRDRADLKLAKHYILELLSTTEAPSNLQDEVENDDSEARDIYNLFPSIFTYLDLASLELKEKVTSRFPLPLLIRQDYNDMTKLIDDESRDSSGSVIVSGQPGTGEFLVSLFHRI